MISRTSADLRQHLKVTFVIASLALIAGACGASVNTGNAAAADSPVKEAQCMRSHGVPNFPDPKPGGPSVIPNWINPQSPAFLSAQKACAKFLDSGPTSSGAARQSEKVTLLNLATCMRAHGFTNFPDPTTAPPPAPPPGSHPGNAIGIGGVYLQFPPQSPALKHAEAKLSAATESPESNSRQHPRLLLRAGSARQPTTRQDNC